MLPEYNDDTCFFMNKDIMKVVFKLVGVLCISQTVHAGVIYGVEQIENQYKHVRYPAYVQIGSFSTINAAERLQHTIKTGSKITTVIQVSSGRYKVRVGPFHNQSSLKAFANKQTIDSHSQPVKQRPHIRTLRSSVSNKASISPLKSKKAMVSEKPALFGQLAKLNNVVQQGSHPELSVFLGGSYIPNAINGQTLQLMPYEINEYADTFSSQSNANTFTWGIEALYRFKLHAPSIETYFFDSFGAGIDVFQITNFNQTGNVAQFGLSEFENYTYSLKLNNIRVMANFDLDFHPIRHYFTPFIQAGVGGARTAISYSSAPISPVDSPKLTLPTQASWNFAYQAGAGIKYVAKKHIVLSLRYLYANMGKANSSTLGSTTTLATPLTVSMSAHNWLFGLTYLVD